MSAKVLAGLACGVITVGVLSGYPTRVQAQQQAAPAAAAADADDPIRVMVGRLDLEKYKATIKGLTQFGDRRQGTDRNRAAVDWIEAQLKSYGCTNTERIKYDYQPAPPAGRAGGGGRARRGQAPGAAPRPGAAAARWRARPCRAGRQHDLRHARTDRRQQRSQRAARRQAARAQLAADDATDRAKRSTARRSAPRRPDEMYIVGAHMDGHGWGEAANDDGSGTALVMELARIFSSPDVQTERSIRFALWNNEETGLNGARAYVDQRKELQGKENPPGSGKYPEPKWLGMIQHDMMMFDHGMPRADGTVSPEQRPRGRRQHRVPVDVEDGGRSRRSSRGSSRRPTRSTRPTIRPRSART